MSNFAERIIELEKIRKRKKIVIIMIPILIIIFIAAIKIFFIKPTPNCFDGIKNGTEEGIDCGGLCLPCGIKYAKPIEVVQTQIVPETINTSEVLIQIKNSNFEYGVKFSYTVTLFGAFGEKLATFNEKGYILPFSTKYLLIQKINIPAEQINRAEVEFHYTTGDWFYSVRKTSELFAIVDKRLRKMEAGEAGFLELIGTLQNNTNQDFNEVDIIVLLYSKTGQVINAIKTKTFNVAAYQTRTFSYTWQFAFPDLNNLDYYRIEILADALE